MLALAGALADVAVTGGLPVGWGQPVVLPAGSRLRVGRLLDGARVYVALRGGAVVRDERPSVGPDPSGAGSDSERSSAGRPDDAEGVARAEVRMVLRLGVAHPAHGRIHGHLHQPCRGAPRRRSAHPRTPGPTAFRGHGGRRCTSAPRRPADHHARRSSHHRRVPGHRGRRPCRCGRRGPGGPRQHACGSAPPGTHAERARLARLGGTARGSRRAAQHEV